MSTAFCLPSNLSMANIAAVVDDLRALPPGGDLVLDATGLTGPDLSVLQLIESLRAQARLHDASVSLAAPADEPLTALLHRAGFVAAMTPDDNAFWFHGVPLQ
ncbi:STAS domain-containing protein [Sphingomonas sp. T9W2]|uniref:STAS domain-containing protein n=1 Tax=Sphingomonas sp. T9W2 TaxID=3143183 RepID=UPI0031F507BC